MFRKAETIFDKILGRRSDAAVKAFIQSEPVRNLLESVDAAEVQRRAAIAKQIEGLPAKHEKACAAAHKEAERARVALEAASAALTTAHQAYSDALNLSYAVSYGYESERSRLTRDLEESADPRINRFDAELNTLHNQARHVLPDLVVDGSRAHFDSRKGQATCDDLMAAIQEVRALRLLPLSTDQVTANLRRIADKLAPVLATVRLKLPAIESDEVQA